MRSLNRPMFKRGGKVSSKNNGIVSGFEDEERTEFSTGGSQNTKDILEVMKTYGLLEQPEMEKGLNMGDYLRIAAAGANIMGAPATGQSGIGGALTAAGPSLAGLGMDLASSYDNKKQNYFDKVAGNKELMASAVTTGFGMADRDEFERALDSVDGYRNVITDTSTSLQEKEQAFNDMKTVLQIFVGQDLDDFADTTAREAVKAEMLGEGKSISTHPDEYEERLERVMLKKLLPTYNFDSIYKALDSARKGSAEGGRVGAMSGMFMGDEEIEASQAQKATMARQGELSQKQDALMNMVMNNRMRGVKNSNRIIEEIQKTGSVLSPSDKDFILERNNALNTYSMDTRDDEVIGRAEGGRVELNEGGAPMTAMPTEQPQQSQGISFEELRARLPVEVDDSVVKLLATSEAALYDFASIESEQDIAIFNQKYNVDLQLPAQVA